MVNCVSVGGQGRRGNGQLCVRRRTREAWEWSTVCPLADKGGVVMVNCVSIGGQGRRGNGRLPRRLHQLSSKEPNRLHSGTGGR